MLYPFKFKPQLFHKLWGGHTIEKWYDHVPAEFENVGEAWVISNIARYPTEVINGSHAGDSLQDLLEVYMDELVGEKVYELFGNHFPLLMKFIRGIAKYEKMEDEVITAEHTLEEEMFDHHRAEAVFAVEDGKEVGFALYFFNFSTFIGHSGLYLEDLYVYPEHRGKGYGKALLLHLVGIAAENHCGRMEWTCLDWNQPSIDFYLSLGAVPMKGWTVYRLDSDTLKTLSGK